MNIKVLITVKTYPILSRKYEESVCTAGITEQDKWIRIYPIPFRDLPYASQYKKYDWIEMDLKRNESDFRPESYAPVKLDTEIKVVGHLSTNSNWFERKKIVLQNVKYDIKELIRDSRNKSKYTSLAIFKPTEITGFHPTSISPEWNAKQSSILSQQKLFASKGNIIKKLPYKFIYEFKDCNGISSKLMVEDWEIGELYWKCLEKYDGNTKGAIADVEGKYLDELVRTKDLYFFLGTTRDHHLKAKNPFMIIGLFYPKKEEPSLFS